jgi:hypothetical protein
MADYDRARLKVLRAHFRPDRRVPAVAFDPTEIERPPAAARRRAIAIDPRRVAQLVTGDRRHPRSKRGT